MPTIVRACRKRIISAAGSLGGTPLLASGNLDAATVTVTASSAATTITAPATEAERAQEVWEFTVSGGNAWGKPGTGELSIVAGEGELFLDGERVIRAAELAAEKWAFIAA